MALFSRINPLFTEEQSVVDATVFYRKADTLVVQTRQWLCDNGEKAISPRVLFQRAKLCLRPVCTNCQEPVYLNDDLGALGVKPNILTDEQREPGFTHLIPLKNSDFRDANGKICSLRKPNDPRFVGIASDHHVDVTDYNRNIQAVMQPGVQREIRAVEEFLLYHLAGLDVSPAIREELDHIEDQCMSFANLADNMWYLGIVKVLALGSQVKEKDGKRNRREYVLRGHKVEYPGENKATKFAVRPRLEMCSSRDDGGDPQAIWVKGKPFYFEATPEFIESVVADVLGISPDKVKITARYRDFTAGRKEQTQTVPVQPSHTTPTTSIVTKSLLFEDLPREYGVKPRQPRVRTKKKPKVLTGQRKLELTR